jgi:hypothetical protein
LKGDGGLTFIQPGESRIPDQVGVVIIIEEEATPDAQSTDGSQPSADA